MPPKKHHDNNKPNNVDMGSRPPDIRGPAPLDDMYNYNEEQQDEFEALSSIFGDDFKKIEGGQAAWQAHSLLAYSIRLPAPSNIDIFVQLEVELPKDYPKVEPKIKITEIQGVNKTVSSQVRDIIKTIPKVNLGTVVIYDICDAITQVLDDAAKVKAGKNVMPSLEDERKAQQAATRKAAEERETQRLRQKADENAQQDQILEQQLNDERAKQEMVRKAEHLDLDEHSALASLGPGVISFYQPMLAKDVKTKKVFTFNKVSGNTILMQRKDKKVTIVTPMVKDDITVPQLVLKDIRLPELASETTDLQNTMRGVEDLLEVTKDYRHSNIVDLLGYSVRRLEVSPGNNSGLAAFWELAVLSEYSRKGSLKEHLAISGALNATIVRSWTHQLLEALEFFDKHGYVHPAVHADNVLIFLSTDGEVTLKLSDGYGTALRTLVVQARAPDGIVPFETPLWTAPEMLQQRSERTNKTCIWDLGVVILQMSLGMDVTQLYTSPTNCVEGNDFTVSFEEVLENIFNAMPRRRMTAFDLQNMEFFRENTSLFNTESPTAPATPLRHHRQSSSFHATPSSRYGSEWEELAVLGKGGFGQVVKARNRLDGQYYAVKKILCKSRQDLIQMVTETKLLSRLNNPYVVRYFNAWDEKEYSTTTDESSSSTGRTDDAVRDYGDSTLFSAGRSGLDPMMEPSIYQEVGVQFGYDTADDESGDDLPNDGHFELPPSQISDDPFSSDVGIDVGQSLDSDLPRAPNRRKTSMREQDTRPEKSTLYIQMELCEKQTLRHLLSHLTDDVDENWRVFNHIVEGLDHIHKSHIVHRDLKPDNIFIDAANNPRIGDFGLAKTGHVTATTRPGAHLVASKDTISIGTPFYVAPELRTKGEHSYTSNVDMYSLGIILFEMCFPMDTLMERQLTLTMMGEAEHTLPKRFEEPKWAAQGRIITRLISHVQESRPSAADLLAGGEIPEPMEDEKLKRYVDGMATTDPAGYQKLLTKFFSAPVPRPKDLAWDSNPRDSDGTAESILSLFVHQKLEMVFRRHGAIETDRQAIFPKLEQYAGAATFLDKSGMVVQLPYDLTFPFARMIARGKPEHPKSYAFGSVYRAAVTSTEPVRGAEVDYDHVSQSARDIGLKEAEVLKVLDEVIEAFPELRSKSWDILLNHADLLDLILNFCQIKPEQHVSVKAVLSFLHVGKVSWQHIHDELRSTNLNIMETSVNALGRFSFRDNLEGATKKLGKIFENDVRFNRVTQLLARMDELITYLKRFKIKAKVYISPLSNYSEHLYRGSMMFQCVDSVNKNLLAVGGRYDNLIQTFQSRSSRGSVRAVGFRLKVSDIIDLMKTEIKKPTSGRGSKASGKDKIGSTLPRRCDVLITSFDASLITTICLDLAHEMWAHGISAELTEEFASMEELLSAYKNESHCLVVIVRHDVNAVGERSIKVRNLSRKDEVEVRPADLIAHVTNEIDVRQDQSGSKLRRLASLGEALGGVPEQPNAEVVILTPQYRSKKVNRQAIVDAAIIRRREVADSFVSAAPIAAVETSDDLIEGMRNTRLPDNESWRAFVQSAPAQEGRYLQQVQEQLKEWALQGKKGAFVFNHRTKACIYYDFGKTL